MRPCIDFVIVTYNRFDDAIKAIDSALAQDGVDGHVFVVDQNSEAGGYERLARHCSTRAGVTLVRNARNTGVSAGRNQAIAMGSAPIIIGLDDDARFADEHQALLATAVLQKDPAIGLAALHMVDRESLEPPPTMRAMASRARAGLPGIAFLGAGYAVRRDAFEAVGGFDERLFFYHEEGDLCYRLINRGYKIGYADETRVLHPFQDNRGPHDSPRRWYFHVRNSIYLAAKYNLSPLAAPLVLVDIVGQGIRFGLYGATARGIVAGLGTVPHGLRQRFGDARVRLTPRARLILRADSPTVAMSWPQRIAFRLGFRANRS